MKVYKDHSNTTSKMNELLKEARQEQPVMNLKEVENIVKTGHYSPLAPAGGFHVGINTVIVMSGIVVSSFLAYMVLKVDRQREVVKLPVTTPVLKQDKNSEIVVPSSEIRTAPTPEPIDVKHTQLKERPKVKADKFLASADKNLVVAENPVENINFAESAPAMAAEVSEKTEKPMPSMRKVLSGEFMITFNYNDQEVKMKLVGDDITGLSIDDRAVDVENYDNYREMISEGKSYLAGHGHEQERNNLDLVRFFDDQLQADKIVADDSPYTFQLTSSQLLINKVSQSDDVFSKYKKLYETKTGKLITSGSTYRFERGVQ